MKKTIVLIMVCFTVATAMQAQKSIGAIFDKYADDERFTYVSVGKGAINLVKSFTNLADLSSEDKEAFSKMNSVKILTLESANEEKLTKSILADVDKIIKSNKYETIAEVRDKGERVNVYVAKDKKELLVVNKNGDEMSLIWINSTKE